MFKSISCVRRLGLSFSWGQAKRHLMTKNFECKDAWNQRLSTGILKKVRLDEMFHELDTKYNQNSCATAVDVDIFVNAINNEEHLSEMEELIYKFRLSVEAYNILPSTHHAFIRHFLEFGDVRELIRILDDRLNYGIFPDNYTFILIMDHLLKKGDYAACAKVATLRMLQEDFDNQFINYISLYACHMFLLDPVDWPNFEPEEEKKDDDGEIVKIRVGYLRNPYFDNHFDLRDPKKLIGKTLIGISQNLNDDMSKSYQLLGHILFENYEIANSLINDGSNQIYSNALEIIEQELNREGAETTEEKTKLQNLVGNLKANALKDDMLALVEKKMKDLAKVVEQDFIDEQPKVFEKWAQDREKLLKNELYELKKKTVAEQIKKKQEELATKEEELFFFDNEDKIDIIIEKKQAEYPEKIKDDLKKDEAQEYVPPEIVKKRN